MFLSGLFLSFSRYGGFEWLLVVKAAAISLFGFEAGLVLNDYIDRDFDRIDLDRRKLTKYWRVFRQRPIAERKISPQNALMLFIILVATAFILILTLNPPNSYWVLAIMFYSYVMEAFSQIKKRNQSFPFAQLIGRTNFALFPIAGYLVNGQFDAVLILYFVFFYPYAQAHLGLSDIVDITNDEIRGLKTIPILYGLRGAVFWVLGFTIIHIINAIIFTYSLVLVAKIGIVIGCSLLIIGNLYLLRTATPDTALKVIPLFHFALLFYIVSIILGFFY